MALQVQFGLGVLPRVFPAGEEGGMGVGVRAGKRGLAPTVWLEEFPLGGGGAVE